MSMYDDIYTQIYGQMGNYQQDLLDFQKSEASADRALRAQQIEGTLANAKKALKQDRMRIEIERGRAEADKWESEQQIKLGVLTHMISRGALGLDYLKTATEWAQTPDNYFKLADFMRGASQRQDVPIFMQALLDGVNMPAWTQQGGAPVPRDINDLIGSFGVDPSQFQVGGDGAPGDTDPMGLDFFGGKKNDQVEFNGQQASQGQQGSQQQAMQQGSQQTMQAGAYDPSRGVNYATPGDMQRNNKGKTIGPGPRQGIQYTAPNQPDPRQQAISGIVKNMLPSTGDGTDSQDQAALNAISALYAAPQNIQPGQFESLNSSEKSLTLAGMAKLGGDPKMWLSKLAASRPGQGTSTGA